MKGDKPQFRREKGGDDGSDLAGMRKWRQPDKSLGRQPIWTYTYFLRSDIQKAAALGFLSAF